MGLSSRRRLVVVSVCLAVVVAALGYAARESRRRLAAYQEQDQTLAGAVPEYPGNLAFLVARAGGRADTRLVDIVRSVEQRRPGALSGLLDLDDQLIPYYTATLVLAGVLAMGLLAIGRREARRHVTGGGFVAGTLVLLAACGALALTDFAENEALRGLPTVAARGAPHALEAAALLARVKFTLSALIVLAILVMLGAVIRRLYLYATSVTDTSLSHDAGAFEELVTRETAVVRPSAAWSPPGIMRGPGDEPWVALPQDDELVGLAFSGGGIRSATFNLGVLQGLERANALPLVDYHSTVSGGGYIGGFWSKWRWLHRTALPPTPPGACTDSAEIRHLREFSRFLSPRVGFFDTDTWHAVIAVIGGLVPALTLAVSIVVLAITAWIALATAALAVAADVRSVIGPSARSVILAVATCVLPLVAALWVRRAARAWRIRVDWAGGAWPWAISLTVVTGLSWWLTSDLGPARLSLGSIWWLFAGVTVAVFASFELWWRQDASTPSASGGHQLQPPREAAGLVVLWSGAGSLVFMAVAWALFARAWSPTEASAGGWGALGLQSDGPIRVSPLIYAPAVSWLGAAAVWLAARLAMSSREPVTADHLVRPSWKIAVERTTMRLVAMALVWIVVAVLWHVSVVLAHAGGKALVAPGGAVVGGALFAALRKWVLGALARARSKVLAAALPYLPQLVAYATITLAVISTMTILARYCGPEWWLWFGAAGLAATFVACGCFINVEEFGLHAFYRDRICRAYLGAVRGQPNGQSIPASANRQSGLREGDDVLLSDLQARTNGENRPLHLVCCAANDRASDPIATLSRAAVSATISPIGLAIGDCWRAVPRLTLGSALTASAAAFNPNMGTVSASLGPVVTFLLAALNLRLGLWVRHPGSARPAEHLLPGLLFYREMFGSTKASEYHPEKRPHDVHLSDGGHFDNLALYELVRRHCRYIIVSDAGADPDVAFDDFGSVVRRVREDFGVNIEINLRPLRPDGDGLSEQHVAVGTIDYGGVVDRGVLIYLKPSLTGDEPVDVRQYRRRNPAFPHESTVDQFFDEAQWESYRQLGDHVASTCFAVLCRRAALETAGAGTPTLKREQLAALRQEWFPADARLRDASIEMTARYNAFEGELRKYAHTAIVHEAFPELAHFGQAAPKQPAHLDDLVCVLRIAQMIEDVWTACDLENTWDHPLNLGWTTAFHRWTGTLTFRAWWPVICPMYSDGVRRFAAEALHLPTRAMAGTVARVTSPLPSGLAVDAWGREHDGTALDGRDVYLYHLELSARVPEVQVGLAVIERDGDGRRWSSRDFYIPPQLWGAGFGSDFRDRLLKRLQVDGVAWCEVDLAAPPTGPSAVRESSVVSDLSFWRRGGFILKTTDPPILWKSLSPGAAAAGGASKHAIEIASDGSEELLT